MIDGLGAPPLGAQPDPSAAVPWRGRPAWVEVDLDAVTANTRAIGAWVGPGTGIMAVVKADGYGLGAVPVATAALAGGATWLAVASVAEGVQLREAGLHAPILVLGPVTPWEMPRAVVTGLTITVNSLEVARALAAAAWRCRVRAPVHLKLDSGLHRFGRPPDELFALAQAAAAMPGLRLEGLYTHFANAGDLLDDFAEQQLAALLALRRRLAERGITFALVHAASSAATLDLPASYLDLVRVGIMLSGHYPDPHGSRPIALQPAVAVRARVARLIPVAAGATVGYGRTYTAAGPRTLALVPLGYADGYPRVLSNCGYVRIAGQQAPVAGRVSMDQFVVDVTAIPGVQEGSPVLVAGGVGAGAVPFDDLAGLAGTISYELLARLHKRLPRVYLQGGEVVALTTLLGAEDLAVVGPLAGVPEAADASPADFPVTAPVAAPSWLDAAPEPAAVPAAPGSPPRKARRVGRKPGGPR